MLSKKSGKLFRIVLRWCNICGGMPFIWNGRRGRVSVTDRGKIRWAIAFLVQIFLCVNSYKNMYRFFPELVNHEYPKNPENCLNYAKIELTDVDIAYWLIYSLVLTVIVIVSINTFVNLKEIVCFTNTYLRFTAHFREAYIARLNRSWRNGCEELVQIMIALAVSAPLLPTIHFVVNPWHPVYLTNYLVSDNVKTRHNSMEFFEENALQFVIRQDGLVTTLVLLMVFFTFQLLFIWIISSTILFLTVNVTIYAFVFTCAIREMTYEVALLMPPKNVCPPVVVAIRKTRGKRRSHYSIFPTYLTKDKLRTCSSLVRCYRSFQMVGTLAHQCFSGLAFAMEMFQDLFVSGSCFIIINFSSKLNGRGTLLLLCCLISCCSVWTFILSTVGRFKNITEECCHSWKFVKCYYVDDFRYMKLVKRSCPPISIWAGFKVFEMNISHVPCFLVSCTTGAIVWNFLSMQSG